MFKVYVGNLSYGVDQESLRAWFESAVGTVGETKVITDRDSGRSKGFGFVTCESTEQREQAIQALNETDFMGRQVVVKEALDKPKDDRGGQRRNFGRSNDRAPRGDSDSGYSHLTSHDRETTKYNNRRSY